MTPTRAPSVCSVPRCPDDAVHRGRCQRHRQTTTDRGYGAPHQRERRAALPGARCENCGCTQELQRDHRVPASLGGREHPSNKRWLCRCADHRCHDKVGVKSSTRTGR